MGNFQDIAWALAHPLQDAEHWVNHAEPLLFAYCSLWDACEAKGIVLRGWSVRNSDEMSTLTVKITVDGEALVCFTSAILGQDLWRIFAKKAVAGSARWVADKYA